MTFLMRAVELTSAGMSAREDSRKSAGAGKCSHSGTLTETGETGETEDGLLWAAKHWDNVTRK